MLKKIAMAICKSGDMVRLLLNITILSIVSDIGSSSHLLSIRDIIHDFTFQWLKWEEMISQYSLI